LSFDIVANTASFTYENGKVSNVASIEMLLEDEIQVFPNPATNFITLKNAVNSTISIIGLNGIEIFNQYNDLNTLNIPLGNNVQRGIYFLRVIDDFGREIATKKIILE
jgi:DNA-binding beta-propeller fold protein YncE